MLEFEDRGSQLAQSEADCAQQISLSPNIHDAASLGTLLLELTESARESDDHKNAKAFSSSLRRASQFELRDLLWAVSMIGVSFGVGLALLRAFRTLYANGDVGEETHLLIIVILLFGPSGVLACFAAGIGYLIGKQWGLLMGLAVGIISGLFLGVLCCSGVHLWALLRM